MQTKDEKILWTMNYCTRIAEATSKTLKMFMRYIVYVYVE